MEAYDLLILATLQVVISLCMQHLHLWLLGDPTLSHRYERLFLLLGSSRLWWTHGDRDDNAATQETQPEASDDDQQQISASLEHSHYQRLSPSDDEEEDEALLKALNHFPQDLSAWEAEILVLSKPLEDDGDQGSDPAAPDEPEDAKTFFDNHNHLAPDACDALMASEGVADIQEHKTVIAHDTSVTSEEIVDTQEHLVSVAHGSLVSAEADADTQEQLSSVVHDKVLLSEAFVGDSRHDFRTETSDQRRQLEEKVVDEPAPKTLDGDHDDHEHLEPETCSEHEPPKEKALAELVNLEALADDHHEHGAHRTTAGQNHHLDQEVFEEPVMLEAQFNGRGCPTPETSGEQEDHIEESVQLVNSGDCTVSEAYGNGNDDKTERECQMVGSSECIRFTQGLLVSCVSDAHTVSRTLDDQVLLDDMSLGLPDVVPLHDGWQYFYPTEDNEYDAHSRLEQASDMGMSPVITWAEDAAIAGSDDTGSSWSRFSSTAEGRQSQESNEAVKEKGGFVSALPPAPFSSFDDNNNNSDSIMGRSRSGTRGRHDDFFTGWDNLVPSNATREAFGNIKTRVLSDVNGRMSMGDHVSAMDEAFDKVNDRVDKMKEYARKSMKAARKAQKKQREEEARKARHDVHRQASRSGGHSSPSSSSSSDSSTSSSSSRHGSSSSTESKGRQRRRRPLTSDELAMVQRFLDAPSHKKERVFHELPDRIKRHLLK